MDREPEASRGPSALTLPSARLNPLLNPLLAKQLGRWAHIYYTASVDKRAAAVEKLVCELEAEAAKLAGTGNTAAAPTIKGPVLVTSLRPEPPIAPQPSIEPPALDLRQVDLREDAQESADAPTELLTAPSMEPSTPPPAEPLATESLGLQEKAEEQQEHTESPVLETAPQRKDWPPGPDIRTAGPAPKIAPELVPEFVPTMEHKSAEDYRSFGNPLAMSDAAQVSPPPARRWRTPFVAAGVLAVLGGSLWIAQSRHSHPAEQARLPKKSVAPPVVAADPPTPAPAIPTSAAAPQSTATPALSAPARSPDGHNILLSQTLPPAEHTQATDPELAAGMRSLQGNGMERNSAEAARHLWQSVKNQNGSALVVLAELYAQGDGVAKDCDQAKILLDAASRQIKSRSQTQRVETARENLRTSGCE